LEDKLSVIAKIVLQMLRPYSCQLLVGAKHLEDKLSVIAKIVLQMLRPYSCQLLVGAKHLEDKLSVIAKNSSPNASPVQLSVVSRGEAFGR